MSPKKSKKDIKGIETIEISSEDDETGGDDVTPARKGSEGNLNRSSDRLLKGSDGATVRRILSTLLDETGGDYTSAIDRVLEMEDEVKVEVNAV